MRRLRTTSIQSLQFHSLCLSRHQSAIQTLSISAVYAPTFSWTGFYIGGNVGDVSENTQTIYNAVTNNVSIRGEYLYYNLGTATYAVAAANIVAAGEGITTTASQKFDGSIARFGLNYKIGP